MLWDGSVSQHLVTITQIKPIQAKNQVEMQLFRHKSAVKNLRGAAHEEVCRPQHAHIMAEHEQVQLLVRIGIAVAQEGQRILQDTGEQQR